jgi:5-methylcytosine-specific restriction endonuclease McrA
LDYKPREKLPPQSRIGYADCVECGQLFVVRRPNRGDDVNLVCRDPKCRRLQKNLQTREWYRRYREDNGHAYTKRYHEQRKAWMRQRINRKLALPYEEFQDVEIFDRDGWICQLCGTPVDRDLKWPHLWSKSLDHIVPLSKGGHHVRANCQLAHVTCNVRKGDREEVA